jgi:hypothetical protein
MNSSPGTIDNRARFARVGRLVGARPAKAMHHDARSDVPCPLCGPSKSKPTSRHKRIWRNEPAFATFHCSPLRSLPPSHAANIKPIDRTYKVWQPRIGRDLINEDARQIGENVTGFFAILAEWSRIEMPANDDGKRASDNKEVRHGR